MSDKYTLHKTHKICAMTNILFAILVKVSEEYKLAYDTGIDTMPWIVIREEVRLESGYQD